MKNPLLEAHPFPPFNEINVEHIMPALDEILTENRQKIASLLTSSTSYTWHNLMEPLEALHDRLNQFWSPISHLHNVANSEALRKVYNECLPKLSAYHTEIGQNEMLFKAITALAESKEFNTLNTAQKKIIGNELRDFRLSGVALKPQEKKQYAELQQQLSQLTTTFAENVLDSAQAVTITISDEKELAGIPEHAIETARERAQKKNQTGWIFTLEQPDYLAIIQHAEHAPLRQKIYESYVTRASDIGPTHGKFDNTQVIFDILHTRFKIARLLGFANAAELSLATKMAKESSQVLNFIHDLAAHAHAAGKMEFEELQAFALKTEGIKTLNPWDIAYYSEKLCKEKFSITQEELRSYFPEDKVLSGMFKVVQTLYDIEISEIKSFQRWHPDVRLFQINKNNQTLAYFYLDLYARSQKRDGAWMDECRMRRRLPDGTVQLPIAYLNCNFAKPAAGKKAQLTHDDILTLFHEFGHGLHHMLTTVDYAGVSGISGVAWDAVELPSQFLENWCWQAPVLRWISSHVETGETLPDRLLNCLYEAKNFQSALQMLRQLEFALFDFRLHLTFDPAAGAEQVQRCLDEVRAEIAVVPIAPFNRFQHSFSHIFAGSYAAGYYSYKWAEVLSSDAFSKFEEHGIFDKKTGQEFLQHILEKGGSEDMDKLFFDFRGREPSIEPLLRHSGLVES